MDEITLTLPREQEWRVVACLVLSGLAARLDLTVESLDEWKLALTELFARQEDGDEPVRIVFRASADELETRFGPVGSQTLAELERDDEGVGLKRVLSTLASSVDVETEGADRWVVLRRAIVHHGQAPAAS